MSTTVNTCIVEQHHYMLCPTLLVAGADSTGTKQFLRQTAAALQLPFKCTALINSLDAQLNLWLKVTLCDSLVSTDLVVAVNHEVQAKELKAMLPPHWVQFIEHCTEGMGGACSHLGHQVLLYIELQKQQAKQEGSTRSSNDHRTA